MTTFSNGADAIDRVAKDLQPKMPASSFSRGFIEGMEHAAWVLRDQPEFAELVAVEVSP